MLEHILRKTIYKDKTPEEFDIIFKFYSGLEYSSFLTCIFLFLIESLLLLIPTCVFINSLETIKALITGGIILLIFFISLILICLLFRYKLYNCLNKIFYKLFLQLYWELYTKKGRAISKNDFVFLRRNAPKLYIGIREHYCKGACQYFSYNLLETLKKGQIYFVALNSVFPEEVHDRYFMHVLYVNNGWCFDTNSIRQYQLEDFISSCKGKVYKTFSFPDIKDFSSFDEFVNTTNSELQKWCKENDCFTWCSI